MQAAVPAPPARPQVYSFATEFGEEAEAESWKYESLAGKALDERLRQLAQPQRWIDTDVVTIQPCLNPKEASQDRVALADWDFGAGNWTFRAVFDGHSGHETVDYTSKHLPPLVKRNLGQCLKEKRPPLDIGDVLRRSITEFDNGLTSALMNLFPGNSIETLSDSEVDRITHHPDNLPIVMRCMNGTTALVSLTNPGKTDLWVASLGDCRAVLASKTPNGSWSSKMNVEEYGVSTLEKLASQLGDRVLGAIAVTRAIGDHVFKLPPIYSRRIFTRCRTASKNSVKKMGDVLPRVLTPPYLSNIPEISHVKLKKESILFLFSDGLFDLYDMAFGKATSMPGFWSYIMREALANVEAEKEEHLALKLLRHGLGGENEDRVSCWLTTQSQSRWMDDTTIVAQRMWC
ncbi:protein serine threonine phosphatase 2C [Coprinopsis sp. MPI-PUGE-AT-0042]|nr:protein serine threonine phosphatase 2C [Coprinopsis sp. MPI-PUGE-AT-0042]